MSVEDEVFDSAYDDTLAQLNLRAGAEGFSIEEIRGELESLYKYEGLDWTGRGDLKHADIRGAIWAYRAFLLRYAPADDPN